MPVFKHYNTQHGLPSSETYSIIQDNKGYIWCSTDRGIVKFDGYTFKTFGNIDGLPDNTVFELFEDNKQRIWFKSFSSATGYIKNDSVFQYKYNNVLKSIHPTQLVSALLVDSAGQLWMSKSTDNNEYAIMVITAEGKMRKIYKEHTKRIYVNKRGECLTSGSRFLTTTEIFSFETQQKIGEYTSLGKFSHDAFATVPNDSGNFFLCAENQIMYISNGKAEKIINCLKGRVLSISVDAEKNIWVGYLYYGLEMYEAKTGYKKVNTYLSKFSVSSILTDTEGAFWFTTLENGIYYLPASRPVFYSETDGLSTPKVNKVLNVGDDIFFILSNYSLILKKKNNEKLTVILAPVSYSFDIAWQKPDKLLYIGEIPLSSRLKKHQVLDFGKKIHVGQKYVWVIDQMHIKQYDKHYTNTATISFENISRITCVFETNTGDLLVGTLGGVFLYKNNKIQAFAKNNPLSEYRISDIKRINAKYIAVATIGHGLYIINDDTYSLVKHYTINNGLPSMMCNTITADSNSVVWVGTNKGLCRIINALDAQKADFTTVDVDGGISSNEINDISIAGGQLWLATANGVSVISKEVWNKKNNPIPVYVEDVRMNDQKINKNITGKFTYKQNNITISFVGLYFQQPAKLLYRYRLLGGDSTWRLTNNRSIVYNSLLPGQYVFEVGLQNPDGTINPITATYSFNILPPFYQTGWFLFLALSVVSFSIYAFVAYRIRFVRLQEQIKSDLNRFRDKALRDQMNPHFVYNSLTSIQNFILKNDAVASASVLSKFSRLMRLTFNNTSQDRVSLATDIEALKLYANLENLRFQDKIELIINIHSTLNPENVQIPPLLIQPFVENAIVHGLTAKPGKGSIVVDIHPHAGAIKITVTDDGVGRTEAALLKERKSKFNPILFPANQKSASSGIKTTVDRINQLWGKNLHKSEFMIVDLRDENQVATGTEIQFCIPLNYD